MWIGRLMYPSGPPCYVYHLRNTDNSIIKKQTSFLAFLPISFVCTKANRQLLLFLYILVLVLALTDIFILLHVKLQLYITGRH